MAKVQAVSFEIVDCGKKISGSKKRFKWRMRIDQTPYTLELINSTLSGKRAVFLNQEKIYEQKSIFNIDFEFQHNLFGHLIKIVKKQDSLTEFEMRIDNHLFNDICNFRSKQTNNFKPTKSIWEKNQEDPFAQFASFASKPQQTTQSNSEFGEFNFDDFATTKPAAKTQINPSSKIINQSELLSSEQFQTKGIKNFAANFQNNYASQMRNEDQFTTNNFSKNNAYIDLLNSAPHERADTWAESNFLNLEPKNQTLMDKINSITAKQIINKVKYTAAQIKHKFTNDSLI